MHASPTFNALKDSAEADNYDFVPANLPFSHQKFSVTGPNEEFALVEQHDTSSGLAEVNRVQASAAQAETLSVVRRELSFQGDSDLFANNLQLCSQEHLKVPLSGISGSHFEVRARQESCITVQTQGSTQHSDD